jgi:hypothetical protein
MNRTSSGGHQKTKDEVIRDSKRPLDVVGLGEVVVRSMRWKTYLDRIIAKSVASDSRPGRIPLRPEIRGDVVNPSKPVAGLE